MAIASGWIVLGILLLVGGGEALLRGAVRLATLARVTPAVIGLTVVAAGTSLPELAVSLLAALQGKEAVAVGNVVGSNIFNATLILGLAAMLRPLAISGNTIKLEYPALVLATLLCLAACRDGSINWVDSAGFLGFYLVFTIYLIVLVRRQMNPDEERGLGSEVEELAKSPDKRPRLWLSLLLVSIGIILLIAGAQATVMGAVVVGRYFGMTEAVIGLTIVAAGTGLPEVVTSLVSSARGRDDVAIGNVIGSNLFNILGTLGISGLIRRVPVPESVIASDNWWMLGVTLLMFPLMYTARRVNRLEGGLLLIVYVVYVTSLIVPFSTWMS